MGRSGTFGRGGSAIARWLSLSPSRLPYFWQMRTTLDIDDALLHALMSRLPEASKTEAIETAIEAFVSRDALAQLRSMAGSIEIEDVSGEFRGLDRTT